MPKTDIAIRVENTRPEHGRRIGKLYHLSAAQQRHDTPSTFCWVRQELTNMERLERITINPAICLGQPTIRGMRITVSVILKMLAGGASMQEVLDAYPELEIEDVQQAMRYAAWGVENLQAQPSERRAATPRHPFDLAQGRHRP